MEKIRDTLHPTDTFANFIIPKIDRHRYGKPLWLPLHTGQGQALPLRKDFLAKVLLQESSSDGVSAP